MQHVNHEAGCVSELALDEWASRELDAAESARVSAHVASCRECRTRHDELERERVEFLTGAPTFVDHANQVRGHAPPYRRSRRHRSLLAQRLLLGASSMATLAAATLLVLWTGEPARETRSKGRADLGWFVKRGEHVHRGNAGEPLHPGDALRFVYSAEAPRYLALFNLDARGATVYYPAGSTAVIARAGKDVALDFSVELDDQLGSERVYAVFCEAVFATEPLRAAIAETGMLPERAGCHSHVVVLHKVAPP